VTAPIPFSLPDSARGNAQIIPSPPWYFSGTWLTIEYRTDPARVRELLPEPLELDDDDPGRVAITWSDFQSSSESGEELLDPVRSQFSEAFLAIKAKFRGSVYSRVAFAWVDRDFSLARGTHMGWPKKAGSIHQTRPFPFGKAPRVEPGGTFATSLASGDRRIAEARIVLREQGEERPLVTAQPMIHTRRVRSIEKGAPDSLHQLVAHRATVEGTAWTADAELRLFDSPWEGLADVEVHEIVGGYYQQVGFVWDGGETVHDYLNPGR
jgi:acetoacetate decarboxylase